MCRGVVNTFSQMRLQENVYFQFYDVCRTHFILNALEVSA